MLRNVALYANKLIPLPRLRKLAQRGEESERKTRRTDRRARARDGVDGMSSFACNIIDRMLKNTTHIAIASLIHTYNRSLSKAHTET